MDVPPEDPKAWLKLAKKYDVESTSIHNLRKFESGSKVKEGQYLALHVLWIQKDAHKFDPEEWGLDRTVAKKHLNGNEHWNSYLEFIGKGLRGNPPLGTFDMLWEYQRIVEGLEQNGPESDKVSISSRTRLQTKMSQPPETPSKKSKQQEPDPNRPSTPSRVPKDRNPTFFDMAEGIDEMTLGDALESSPDSILEETPMSIAILGKFGDYYELPPVNDEQIVNTALILLLQGVCLRYPGMKNSEWTLQRKSFDFTRKKDETTMNRKKGKKKADKKDLPKRLFQARTDGHLRINLDGESRSLAILEVKSKERLNANPFMQESTQMASWIHAEPDVKSGSDSTVYR
jgi:hypothetical protein